MQLLSWKAWAGRVAVLAGGGQKVPLRCVGTQTSATAPQVPIDIMKTESIMDVILRPELERLIAAELDSGRSTDPNEFLDKAVYHYVIARELGEAYTREEIDEKIARGLAQAELGETEDGYLRRMARLGGRKENSR